MRTPAASAALTARALAESRSPTSTSTRSPSAAACSRPESAAITKRGGRQRPHGCCVRSGAAAHDQGAPRCCRRRLHAPSVPGSRRARGHAGRSAARRRRAAGGAARAATTTSRRRSRSCPAGRPRTSPRGCAGWGPGAADRAPGRGRGGSRGRGGDGAAAASSWRGRWSRASAPAPWSHSSRPTAHGRSRAIAAPSGELGPGRRRRGHAGRRRRPACRRLHAAARTGRRGGVALGATRRGATVLA